MAQVSDNPPGTDLAAAKEALLVSAARLDPLNVIRDRPFVSIGAIGAIGALAGTPLIENSAKGIREIMRFTNVAMAVTDRFVSGIRYALKNRDRHVDRP